MNDSSSFDRSSQEPNPDTILQKELERMAALLHDDVLQTFGVCVLKAQLCERLAQKGRYNLVDKELALLEEALNSAIDSVRELIATIRRPLGQQQLP